VLLPKAIMSGAFGGALGKVAARKIRWCLTGLLQCIGGAGGVRLPVAVRCLWLEWSYGFQGACCLGREVRQIEVIATRAFECGRKPSVVPEQEKPLLRAR